jgi:RHS repeat-associated protein
VPQVRARSLGANLGLLQEFHVPVRHAEPTDIIDPAQRSQHYTYNNVSNLLSVLHQLGTTTLDGASYTYDLAGNRKTRTDKRLGTTLTYAYDNIYQLLTAKQGTTAKESYTGACPERYSSREATRVSRRNPVGNRLSSVGVSPYSYNSSNQLTSIPGTSYTYDNNGNTKTTAAGTTTYTWDFKNRLTQVALPGTAGTVTYKYDPFGRRVQKAFTQGGNTTTTNYLYDGLNLMEELDASGNVLARYVQGQNFDEPLSELRNGTTNYYQQDALGSVSSLSSEAGALANTYTFDSFGKLTASTGSLSNPFQYTGREFDSETSLYYYRARYYDPQVGRFMNEDQVRFRSGVDFYTYVRNSPADLRDPSGNDPALDGMVQGLLNMFPNSQLLGAYNAKYILIHRPCSEVARMLQSQGFETGALPPFNNPFDHAGGFEFRTRGKGPGFHFRMPYSGDPTDPMHMGSPLSPCQNSNCVLDQFHHRSKQPSRGKHVGSLYGLPELPRH